MKKLLMSAFAFIVFASSASAQKNEKAGLWKDTEKGTTGVWSLGSDKVAETVSKAVEAYNNLDLNKYLTYFTDDYVNRNKTGLTKLFNEYKSVNKNVFAILPLRSTLNNEKFTYVQLYSERAREWKNGSKSKENIHEFYIVNDTTNKIQAIYSFNSPDQNNEFGLPNGGKVFSKTDTTTMTLTNRGEVEIIENLARDWNKKDGKAIAKYFDDTVSITNNEGRKFKFSNSQWATIFDDVESVEWKLGMIFPSKITNSDPVSGIIVLSNYKEKKKDGTSQNVRSYHWFGYGINKKITSINWMSSPILPATK
jgi:ketosteroid isomerase-like protein